MPAAIGLCKEIDRKRSAKAAGLNCYLDHDMHHKFFQIAGNQELTKELDNTDAKYSDMSMENTDLRSRLEEEIDKHLLLWKMEQL